MVKRWYELENTQPQLPQSFAEALQLAADQARQLELAAPKVAHYDAVVAKDHLLTATQVASKLRMSAVALNLFLITSVFITRLINVVVYLTHGLKIKA